MPPSNTNAQLQYQVCPIILSGGIAGHVADGMMPILSLFHGTGFNAIGLPFDIGDLDDAFGAFNVLPGGTLISQQIAKYPFANQYVAANATIVEPLTVSVIMDTPMRGPNAWDIKRLVFTALQGSLAKHNNMGGTYILYTPAFMYVDLILTSLTDNSRTNNSLPQNAWRFDFEKPLVALSDLVGSFNSLMGKANAQTQTSGNITGPQPGLTNAQSPLTAIPQVGLGGTIASDYPSTAYSSQIAQNYPAMPNVPAFSFNGIP